MPSKDPMIDRMITHSIAPTIYGSEDVKQAIALQLFGGIAKEMPDGTGSGATSTSSSSGTRVLQSPSCCGMW